MTPPTSAAEVLRPLIGQIAWGIKSGIGVFWSMEFGAPHLRIREPISPKDTISDKVKWNLARRRVFVVGEWHLWVQYAAWEIRTPYGCVSGKHGQLEQINQRFAELDGQKLVSISLDGSPRRCKLEFDLGAVLSLHSSEANGDQQWSLRGINGSFAELQADGQWLTDPHREPLYVSGTRP